MFTEKLTDNTKFKMGEITNIKTGDIVKIENAFFKSDNGYYFVEHSNGDVDWIGSDYCLKKICKNGKLSTTKYSTCFWPLCSFTNNSAKNSDSKKWNAENATIEKIDNINKIFIKEYFLNEVAKVEKALNRNIWDFGEDSESVTMEKSTIEFYTKIISEIEKTSELEKAEESPTAARSEGGAGFEKMPQMPETVNPETAAEVAEISKSSTAVNSPIDENLARRSLESYSFSDYKNGSATAEYTQKVLEVRQLAENVKQKVPEELHGELDRLVGKYAAKLAAVTNDINRCNASCPSWFITGAANYPMRKHEKQQARLSNLYKEFEKLDHIKDRIRGFVNRPIMSGDETAVERLSEKIEKLKSYQEQMKQENAQARKNGTAQPHPTWELSNNRQNLKATEDRLNDLKKAKETPTAKAENLENEFCKVVKNSDIMRLQLIFDGKPSEETRNILKSNGFKWAPSQKAWQRQLTPNAERSFKNYVLPKLSELQTVSQ